MFYNYLDIVRGGKKIEIMNKTKFAPVSSDIVIPNFKKKSESSREINNNSLANKTIKTHYSFVEPIPRKPKKPTLTEVLRRIERWEKPFYICTNASAELDPCIDYPYLDKNHIFLTVEEAIKHTRKCEFATTDKAGEKKNQGHLLSWHVIIEERIKFCLENQVISLEEQEFDLLEQQEKYLNFLLY